MSALARVADWFRDVGHRGYVYRIALALGVLAVAYGFLTDVELSRWLGFLAVLLGTGTAVVNTPTTAQLNAERGRTRHTPATDRARQLERQAGDVRDGRVRRKFER